MQNCRATGRCRWKYLVLAEMLLLAPIAGCGGPTMVKTYPVKGKLTLDGKPYGPANLVLTPIPADRNKKDSGGEADADGNLTITTYSTGDGAPGGEFRVYIPAGGARGGKPIPAVYESATDSPLRITVAEKPTEVSLAMDTSAGAASSSGSSTTTIPTGIDPSKMAMPKTN